MKEDLYKVIGMMSGTSLDGLDIVYCEFRYRGAWEFRILHAVTVPYSRRWKDILSGWHHRQAEEQVRLNVEYGHFLGRQCNAFIRRHGIRPGLIASHGHTVFHQPEKGFTFQAGSGAAIAAETGVDVVCDFRSVDIAQGGQGAPLVPAGEPVLFPGYSSYLNLGGIANITISNRKELYAFDVCACNMVLNMLARREGLPFDKSGKLAAGGKIIPSLLKELNGIKYLAQKPPKSLGREQVEKYYRGLLSSRNHKKTPGLLATASEHIAIQIGKAAGTGDMLVTGGGAHNAFLVSRIRSCSKANVVVPGKDIVNFKEALIFAFLGVLRIRGEMNCLKSVTGARKDSCGGSIYKG